MGYAMVLLLLSWFPAAAQEDGNWSHLLRPMDLWNGSKPGTFVETREVQGLGPEWKQEWSVTKTLRSQDAKESWVEVIKTHDPKRPNLGKTVNKYDRKSARDATSADSLFNAATTKTQSQPDEEVRVGERKIQCRVSQFEDWKPAFHSGIKVGHSLRLWHSDEIPGGVVKAEGLEVSGGDRSTSCIEYVAQLTSLDEKISIKNKEVR